MQFTIEVDDAVAPSLERYLDTQVSARNDDMTGVQVIERKYEGIEHFLAATVGDLLHQIAEQHPTGERRKQMEQERAQQAARRKAVTPKVTRA